MTCWFLFSTKSNRLYLGEPFPQGILLGRNLSNCISGIWFLTVFVEKSIFLEASRLPVRNISRHFFITKLEVTITRGIHEAIANYAYLFFVTNNPQKGTAPGGFPWSPALFLTLFSTKKEYWHACFQERIHQHLFRHESHFNTRVCLTHQAHLYAELTFVLKGIVLVTLGTWVSKEWCKRAYNNLFVTKLR